MPSSRSSAGRRGALEESRELVTLVSSLSEAGDALTVEAVSSRLGVSDERARKLLSLVMSAGAGEDAVLPLVEDGADEVTLLHDAGMRGRAVRLTHTEALALVAALDRIGLRKEDGTRAAIESALFSSPVDEGTVARLLGADGTSDGDSLSTCASAIYERRAVTFDYRGADSDLTARRTVLPQGLRCEGESWYLDGWDLDRRSERTFRLDRMSLVKTAPAPTGARAAAGAAHKASREVRLVFRDERPLSTLPWHGLAVAGRDANGNVVAHVAYYGGEWLVRMLAACGGTVTVEDEDLASRVRDYARSQLDVG